MYNNNSSGKIGIGTNTPTTALQVVGTITATAFNGALSGNATTATTATTAGSATTAGNLTGNPAISVSSINLNAGNITNGGTITATTFNGSLNGNASTAGSATNLSGNPAISVGSINVNGGNISSVGTITASTFTGSLNGNALTATNANNATNASYATTAGNASGSSFYVKNGANGFVQLSAGGADATAGYIEFYNAYGLRRCYMGFNRGGYISMTTENDCIGFWMNSELKIDGIFTALFYAVNNTGTDYLGVIYNFSDTSTGVIRQANAMLGSFTGFHRCFTNDELFNDENEETIKDFKFKYAGRVVISSGEIATDDR